MKSLNPPQRRNRERNGRYRDEDTRCDLCARGIDTQASAWFTDDDACDGNDGPGFYLCRHPTCQKMQAKVAMLPVEARRAIYTKVRDTGKPQRELVVSLYTKMVGAR